MTDRCRLLLPLGAVFYCLPAAAEDIRLRPGAGDALVIESSSGTTEHFRIDEATGFVDRAGSRFFQNPGGQDLYLGTGSGPTAVGSSFRNTGIGTSALAGNADGDENVAIGASSMLQNTAGSRNTAIGTFTLEDMASGTANTGVGYQALRRSSSGASNVAVGSQALLTDTGGVANVALGAGALSGVDGGDLNIAVGAGAGAGLQSGDDNIYVGSDVGSAVESGQIRIGSEGTHTDTFLVGDTSTDGTLGVGTRTPDRDLTIDDVDGGGGAGLNLKATGRELLFAVNQSTGGIISMETDNDLDFRTDGAIGRLRIKADGKIGIGDTTPSHPLDVGTANGAHVTAGGVWTNGSSRAFKEAFVPVDAEDVLAKVKALPIQRWRYKGDRDIQHMGPMAEEFHASFGLGSDARYIGTVDADGVALAAIQALTSLAEQQRAELDMLRDRVADLEAESAR